MLFNMQDTPTYSTTCTVRVRVYTLFKFLHIQRYCLSENVGNISKSNKGSSFMSRYLLQLCNTF